MLRSRSSFTLIELLVVVAVVAILAVVVVLVLQPQELLKQGRDSTRVAELGQINRALTLFQAENSSVSLGTASTIYISITDPTATSTTLGNACIGISLPSLPSGYSYHCAASSTYRNTDGTGWIPVNFSSISSGSPFGNLPQDPTNNGTSSLYYAYTPAANGTWELSVMLEAKKYATAVGSSHVQKLGSGSGITPVMRGDDSIVAYWKFDDATGTVAIDSGGNLNTGTLTNGPTWSTGQVGSAITFDGVNDYVDAGTGSSLDLGTNPFSVSLWRSLSSGGSGYLIMVGKKDGSWASNGWHLRAESNNSARFVIANGSDNIDVGYTIPGSIGTWHHIVGVRNGNNAYIYVDGVEVAATTNTIAAGNVTSNVSLKFGYLGGWGNYNGLVDDVRIYKRALSASEISAIYNATR